MIAVILAAGRGSRLRPLTDTRPKALIPMGRRPLIDYSLANLLAHGINEVFVVTGYRADQLRDHLEAEFADRVQFTYIHNPDYRTTGSMYSLALALADTDGRELVVLESDLLYEARALEALRQSDFPNDIMVAPLSGSGDEVLVFSDREGNLMNLGKALNISDNPLGELAGITRLESGFYRQLLKLARQDFEQNLLDYHYEEVILRLARQGEKIHCRSLPDLAWTEIDNADDYQRAVNIVLPQLLK